MGDYRGKIGRGSERTRAVPSREGLRALAGALRPPREVIERLREAKRARRDRRRWMHAWGTWRGISAMAAKRQRADLRDQERPAALANVVFALGLVARA